MSVSTLQPPNEDTCNISEVNPYGIDELTHQPPNDDTCNKSDINPYGIDDLTHQPPEKEINSEVVQSAETEHTGGQCQVEEGTDLPGNQIEEGTEPTKSQDEVFGANIVQKALIVTAVCVVLYGVLLYFSGY